VRSGLFSYNQADTEPAKREKAEGQRTANAAAARARKKPTQDFGITLARPPYAATKENTVKYSDLTAEGKQAVFDNYFPAVAEGRRMPVEMTYNANRKTPKDKRTGSNRVQTKIVNGTATKEEKKKAKLDTARALQSKDYYDRMAQLQDAGLPDDDDDRAVTSVYRPKDVAKNTKTHVQKGVKINREYDPVTNEYVTTYEGSPSGIKHRNRADADLEHVQYEDYLEKQKAIKERLEDAYKERERLEKLKDERGRKLEATASSTPNYGFATGVSGGLGLTSSVSNLNARNNDAYYQTLVASEEKNNSTIRELEALRDGGGAWKGFKNTLNLSNWDFGFTDLGVAATLSRIKDKTERGEELTSEEKALLVNTVNANVSEQEAADRLGGWYRAGKITGQSLPFSAQFALAMATGGTSGLISFTSKAATKGATRFFGDAVGKAFLKQTAREIVRTTGRGLSKAAGTAAGEIAASAAIATTTGAGTTAADVINRHSGQVVQDESGNYRFDGGENWGKAIYKGIANATIENYTEMLGEHIPGLGKLLGRTKLGRAVAASNWVDSKAARAIWRGTKKASRLTGVQGLSQEIIEEEINIPLNALFVGDNKMSDLLDKRTQLDIIGGISLSVGATHLVTSLPVGVQYVNANRKLKRADKLGETNFNGRAAGDDYDGIDEETLRAAGVTGGSRESWSDIKGRLDEATNDEIAGVVNDILSDYTLTHPQQEAVFNYYQCLMQFRGFNQAAEEKSKEGDVSGAEASHANAYIQGHEALTPRQKKDIQKRYEYAENEVRKLLGVEDGSPIGDITTEQMQAILTDSKRKKKEKQTILDYFNSKAAYDGMIKGAQDRVEDAVSEVDSQVQQRVHKSDGAIHSATLKQGDRKVYIISGNVQMLDDGSKVDREHSDSYIVVRDAQTEELESVAPEQILSVDDAVDAEEERENAVNAIKEEYARREANAIDGTLTFEKGDEYNIIDGAGQPHTVRVVGQFQEGVMQQDAQGNVIADPVLVIVDGVGQQVISKAALQQMSDAETLSRLNASIEERIKAQEIQNQQGTAIEEEQQAQVAAYPFAVNDEIEVQNQQGTRKGIVIEHTDDGVTVEWIDEQDNPVGVQQYTPEELQSLVISYNETQKETQGESGGEGQTATQSAMPMVKDRRGKETEQPDYYAVTPQRTHSYLYNESDIPREAADQIVAGNLKKAQKTLKAAQAKKPQTALSPAEYKRNQEAYDQAVNAALAEVDYWNAVKAEQDNILVTERRQSDEENMRKAEEEKARKEAEEQARKEAEEQARIERERLNGVPDVVNDKPADARARGFRSVNGYQVKRQENTTGVVGREATVKFSDKDTKQGRIKVIEADELQPSHVNGQRNAQFFIDEAQPKDRTDAVSTMAAAKIAANLNPEEITGDGSAYQFSAPTTNTRGEVVQGNNRSEALKLMWSSSAFKPAQDAYKQYLTDHAEEFGLDAAQIAAMKAPVMVNEIDVSDDEAIRLGQLTAKNIESGGVERIDPVTTARTLGSNVGGFARVLLQSDDENASISDVLVQNGTQALKYLHAKGAISDTQYRSAFDSKGNITAEAKQDLQNILKNTLFEGGVSDLPAMFAAMPAKAQKALLSTFMRDFDSAESERILPEIQDAITVWAEAASTVPEFKVAKSYEEAKQAMRAYTTQFQMMNGESVLPAEQFSNFAIELACRLQGQTMSETQQQLGDFFDLVQGKSANLFNQEEAGVMHTAVEAIRQVYGIGYKQGKRQSNGQERSHTVARNSTQSQAGRQGSSGDTASGEPTTQGAGTAQRGGGTASDSEQGQQTEARSDDGRGSGVLSATRENSVSQREEVDENGRPFIKAEDGTTIFGEIRNDSGLTPAPIKLSEGYQDEEGKGYGLAHIEAKHGDEIRNAGFASVEEFVSYVAKNYDEDNIRFGKRRDNGSPTFLIQITDTHDNTLFIELSKEGTYWNVNSAGVFRKGYSNKKETVAKTEPQQPNNAVSTGSSLSESGEGGITPSEPNGKPTVSDGKVTESSKTEQENGGKTVIDKYQEYLDGIEVEKGKLPKGVKWTDGVEKKTKGGKHSNAETVGAVFVGNDLYVRKKYATDQTIVVKNATSLNANDVVAKFDIDAGDVVSPLLSDAIFEVYQKAGLPINNNGVHLRPLMPTTKEAGTRETKEPTETEGVPEKPQIKEGESPIEYAARVAEWQNVKDCIDAGVAYSEEFDDLKRRIKEIAREDDEGKDIVEREKERNARLAELYADYRAKHGESGRMAEYREAANKVFEDYYQKAKANLEAQDTQKLMREAPDKILRGNIEMWENAEENADGVVDKDIALFITGEYREPSINSGLTNTLIGDEARLKAKRDALPERAKAELARREKHPQKQKEAAEQDYKEKTLWMKMRPDGSAIYAYIAARSGGMLDVRFFWGDSESDGEAKKMTIDELRNTFGGKQVEVGSAALPATQVPKIENYIKRYGKKRLRESLKQTATNGTKPVATEGQASDPAEQLRTVGYTIEHRKDTRDNSDLYAVKFDARVSREEFSGQRAIAKRLGGYWSNFGKKGFLFKTEEAAQDFAETVMGRSKAEVEDEAPLSLADMQQKNEGASEDASKPASEQQQTETQKPVNPSGNKLVTDERYAELRERMRKKMLGQMNMGIDPEILAIGTEMAVYHIEKGARRFVDYAKAMIADLGDAIRPYLKAFYNGARDLPEMEAFGLSKEMTPYDEVASVDIANFDKQGAKDLMATAENIVKEQEVSQQAEEAEEKLRAERGAARKAAQEKIEAEAKRRGLKRGDKVLYKRYDGRGEWEEATITDFGGGVDVTLDTGNAPVMYEAAEFDQVKPIEAKEPKETKKKEKSVSASSSDIETKPVGKRNGTATPQSGLSEGKGNKKVGGNRAKAGKPVSSPTEPSLFDNVEPQNDKDNGLQRVYELRSERLSADKTNTEQPVGEHGADVIQEGVGRADGRRDEEVQGVPEGSSSTRRPVGRLQGLEQPKNTHNNHAERGTDYAPRGENARIEANIKAIETMQRLIESGERATPEDMAVLRRFSGWGGLDSAFNEGGAFSQASPYNAKLRQLLTPEQYESANMSRNSAYYTPAEVIDAMWDVARAMGFKGGKVLEGSAGIGNILGLMPTEMSERSDIHAVEKDDVTGQILSLLYPDAKVDVQGFEKTQIPNGSVDLAITNVPFVTRLHAFDETGDKDLSRKFANIHDFCIAKNVRKLRQGGIGIFISSSGTLDSTKLRGWLTSNGGADVVGAFRLNNKTFGGTRATSDIIVVRKRVNGKKSVGAIDVSGTGVLRVVKYDNGEGKKDSVKDLALSFNKYFVEHPENMAGEMAFAFEKGETFRATSKALYPTEGKDQSQMLKDWAKQFANMDWEAAEAKTENAQPIYEDLGEGIKEGSMLLDKNGTLCIAREGAAVPLLVNSSKVKGHTKAECFNDYKAIQDALEEVLQYQTEHEDDKGLQPLLKKLNKAYDDFVSTYGHLNKNTAISFLRSDIDFASIAALEKVKYHDDEHHKRIADYKKAEVFSHRVVEKETVPTPKNVRDGVISSVYLNGKIDIPYIAAQLQRNADEVRKEVLSEKLGFENPITREIEVSYEYLSGNVREKLEQARAVNTDGRYDSNIRELETKVPFDIPAHLIEFTLGSTFLEPRHYADYIKDRTDADVSLTNTGGMWVMKLSNEFSAERSEKNRALGVWSDKCSKWIYGHQLIEAAIQNKTISVTKSIKHYDGKTETIKDKDATLACTQKIGEIRTDFKDWMRQRIQNDTELAQRIEKEYNERFNAFVPKEIDKKFIPGHFAGQITKLNGKDFHLYDYQAKAAILATMQPTLFAHEVGAGKTYTLITTAMEMRRLGTAHKPMIVVQNATVGQFVESAKELYPGAKVLALEDADRTKEGRKNFYAKIRYNDWDMIVIPQSVFERIPDSPEREARFKQEKIEETMHVLEQMREARGRSRKKSLQESRTEKELANLQAELNDILAGTLSKNPDGTFKDKTGKDKKREAKARENAVARAAEMLDRETDDTLDFDDMGIDALLIDEAHEYKHLGFRTATQRGVKGVDSSYSKKSQGVYLKTQAVLENTGGKNVVFATGTPISNTAAEVWTFMRYLVPADTMKAYDIYYFDDFVRNFGLIEQRLEFNASGSYKEVSRFSGYVNLPELVRIWTSIADTVRTDEVEDLKEKIPEMEDGKPQDVFLPQTPTLRGVMKTVREMLADYERMSGMEKKENSHIPLTAYGIAKAAAVDARLVVDDAPDEANSKTNETVRQTLRSLEETKDYNGTIAIFSDNYQNKASGFNLYEDIKKKLIAAGVPESQIVIMKPGMGIKSKLEIFDKVNSGEVRVIMGSTFTLGTGVNIQERLHTLIHVDAPVRPMDYTQRNGRILRQGNMHKEWGKPVRVLRFGVEDSLDVTAYDRLKTKQKIADSVMSGRKLLDNAFENRVLEEEDDIFGDITAQLSGSQYALLKNQMEKEVRKLTTRKEQWQAQQTYIHNQRPKLQGLIKAAEERKATAEEALKKVEAVTDRTITVAGQRFSGVEEMGDYIKEFNKKQRETQEQVRKSYDYNARQTRNLTVNVGGIDFIIKSEISKEQRREKGQLSIAFYASTKMTYDCPTLGLEDVPVKGQQIRAALDDITENVMSGDDMRERIEAAEASKERNAKELETLSKNDGKPFADAEKLETAKAKLEEYTEKMKEELAEKEAKYAKMDSEVEAVKVHEAAEVEDEDTATGEGERAQKSVGDTMQPTEEQREQGAALVEIVKEAGLPVSMDVEEMRNALLEGDAQYHAQISSLGKAAKTIKEWLAGGSRGKTFTIELPESTQRKVRQVMGRDFDSHNITANGVAHAKRNHGEQGTKLTDESIPLRDEDFELIPYIMTAPDRVEKGSTDASGRESVRFYKTLSNGYVVVVEKEYKNSPDDMETITMWAEKSSAATNARSEKNAPDTLVRNAIRSTDAAKVRKDAETAIANDRYLQKMTVFHGSAHSFDRFDHSHMGEGEGAQVHGWGTYVAVDKKTSRGYAEGLSPRKATYKGTYGLKEIQEFGIEGKEYYELYPIEGIIGYMERHPSWSFDDAQDLFISQTEKSRLYSPILKEKIIEAAKNLQKEDFKTQATRNLYSVEIPDNNGRNYLEERKAYSGDEVQELAERLLKAAETDKELLAGNKIAEKMLGGGWQGKEFYGGLTYWLGSDKAASQFLNKAGFAGIHYFGGQDGECYVIFNEKDMKITSHEQFLRTKEGEVYGFVKGGKMYIDPRLLNPNTPIHEYTHLWDTALRKAQPKLWARGKELMKQLPLWEEVKNDHAYKDIAEDEDLLASEVHSRLSGAEGERLLAKMTEEAKKKGAMEYAEKLTLAQRIKQWMKDVLKFVRDAFAHKWDRGELESVTVEEFARMPIKDLMRGFNPTEAVKVHEAEQPLRTVAEGAARSLGLSERVEVITDTSELQNPKDRKAKGWYDTKTGRIAIVLPNHTSAEDVRRTILHEGVAHYGLRQLFGDHFDEFLRKVYEGVDAPTREQISRAALRGGFDFGTSTEEYLASLAETTNFEKAGSTWQKIKHLFKEMLRGLGFDIKISDGELRYILWRSYENLKEPDHYRNVFAQAEDIATQHRLKVGKYAVRSEETESKVADGGKLYRTDAEERDRVYILGDYEKAVASSLYQFQEAMQDSMLGLKTLMNKILKASGQKEAADFENAYMAENALSSKNKAEADAYKNLVMKPLLDAIAELKKEGATQEEITDYMMAKHGLERNALMAQRAFDEYQKAHPTGQKTLSDFLAIDYAGLTALTKEPDAPLAAAEAQRMVDDFESGHDTTDLWEKTNAATKATLSKIYESGLLSKDRYEEIRDMYEYYIPLRGWDDTTSDEVYGYLTSKNGAMRGSIMKKAEGRRSKADDPIATIAAMAEAGISQGNRNMMKQKFLNFALNHPSDAVSVNGLWLKYDDVTDDWIPLFADIDKDDDAATVKRKINDFENKLKQLAEQEPDKYMHGKDTIGIPYVVKPGSISEHQVIVQRGGRTYVLTINGNPRAAQALNGLTNPNVKMEGAIGDILKAGDYINRQMSAFYTTRNPNFVASNFIRDALYANSMVWVKESPNYALRFHRNFAKYNPTVVGYLLNKYEKGTLDMGNKKEQMFYQFMMNGGETGYTVQRDIEAHKRTVRKELAKRNSRIPLRKAFSLLGERFDDLNRSVENCARFAAFATSREMGRSVEKSVWDAKEISVNFNKKGAGSKFLNATGQTNLGKIGAFVSGGGRTGYVFWNAAIQGTCNIGKGIAKHPAKGTAMLAATYLLGTLIPLLGGDGDGDDEKNYYNLPDFVRRSNICFRIGDKWVTIPLSVELRTMYGLGELATSVMTGNEKLSGGEIAKKIAEQISQAMPLDFMEGGGGLSAAIPSSVKPVVEAYINKDWTGLPIYKDTPYDENMPSWTKAYSRTNHSLINLSKTLNEWTGGDDYKKGWADLNPAVIEHLLEGAFGGVSTTINQMQKTAETISGEREFDWRNIPIASRVVKNADERTKMRSVNEKYFKYRDEFYETQRLLNKYEHAADEGLMEYAEKLDFLNNSKQMQRFEVMEDYIYDISDLQDDIKEAEDDTEREELQAEQDSLKVEMVEALRMLDE